MIVIKEQNGNCLYNWDDISDIHVSPCDKGSFGIQAERKTGRGGRIATYRQKVFAEAALDMLYIAIRDGEWGFEFPPEDGMTSILIHREKVRTKANSHGGS